MAKEVCRFAASLPPIQSAINAHGGGDGARIKLDVPESDFAEVLKLVLMRGKVFEVVVVDPEG